MASNVVSCEDIEKSKLQKGRDEVTMGRTLDKDAKRRKVTTEIYDSVLVMLELKGFQNIRSELTAQYNDYTETIRNNRTLLQKKNCPIVVTGDTSAGKSSLVNLLIAKDLLPCEVLSTSTAITKLFNSKEKKAKVTEENGKQIQINNPTLETLNQYIAGDQSEQNPKRYKSVDISWPVPLLKDHACIVDTPGIGECGEIPNNLLDFLSEAVAFIYVINVANAGGVQQDRIGKIFDRQQELEQRGSLHQFDPDCAIFVLNKWDQVPDREDTKVWEAISRKLRKYWPTSRNTDITEQMFKLSVTEETAKRKCGMENSERFQSLVSGFERLVGACLERRVKRHLYWLQTFLNRVLTTVIAKKNASRNGREINNLLKQEVEQKLKLLKNQTEIMKSKMKKLAEERCMEIADLLRECINKEETIQKMCNWHEDDLPNDKDFTVVREKATQMISERIRNQIIEMSRELTIKDKWTSLFDDLKKECKVIKANVHEIDQIIKGNSLPLSDKNLDNWSSCTNSSKSGSESSLIETFFLIATGPIWVPVVVIALPFVYLGEFIGNLLEIRRYKQNKISYMNTLTKEVIKKFDTDAIYNDLGLKLLEQFMSSLNKICEDIIPNLITADQKLLENISKENRDSQTLLKEYTPIELHCKDIIGHLLYVKIKYFHDKPIRILKEEDFIGKGSYAEVHKCHADIGGRMVECAVKRLTTDLQHSDRYLQLSEAENMLNCQHKNIVSCLGILIPQKKDKEYLEIYMELCDCSLADVFLCNKHPKQMCQCNHHRRETCHRYEEKTRNCQDYNNSLVFFTRMLKDILDGLVYLHDEGFTHRDLKLSNILMKAGTAKIADIGLLKPQPLVQGTIIGTLAFMAPEVLEGRIYDSSADIFSLAITMWEMWYGRSVFSSCEYRASLISFTCLKESVIKGIRPSLDAKWTPPEMIKKMIEDCWEKEPKKRPTAKTLTATLRRIVAALIHSTSNE